MNRVQKWFGVVVLGMVMFSLNAQTRSSYFDQPAQIVPPEGYREQQLYPAIIFLPYTSGTSNDQARSFGILPGQQKEFVVILPAGRFHSQDYLPNFMQFVEWYETRLLQDLNTALSQYSIDPDRVYLAGYSLGGDLGWALSARNPELFAGAVMAGTRASYPMSENSRQVLSQTGYRGYFLIGDQEDPNRTNGINLAYSQLNSGGVLSRLQTYPGGHRIPPQGHLATGVEFISQAQRIAWAPSSTGNLQSNRAPSATGRAFPWASFSQTVFLRNPSMHFGIRYAPNFSVGSDGFQSPSFHQVQFRAEGLFDDIYLRGLTSLSSQPLSTGYKMNSFTQEVALAYGGQTMWGLGFGWDWNRGISSPSGGADEPEGSVVSEEALRAFYASLFWIHPRRMQGIPASVLELRYQIPQGFRPFLPSHVFNTELRYRLHVTDKIMITAGLGSITTQNRPFVDSAQLENGLDHRIFWQGGIAFRVPGPFRWSIHHTGSRITPRGSDSLGYQGEWNFALEYLF